MTLLRLVDYEDTPADIDFQSFGVHSGALNPGGIGLTQEDVLWSTATGVYGRTMTPRTGSKSGFGVVDSINALGDGAHPAWVGGGYRSEFSTGTYDPVTGDPWHGVLADKPERWYGMSYRLPTDWDLGPSPGFDDVIMWQVHRGPSGGGGSPVLAFKTNGAHTVLQIAGKAGGTAFDTFWYTFPIAEMVENWVDIAIHIKWSLDADGFIHIYKNQVLVASFTNVQTYWRADTNVGYTKWPIYGSSAIVYFDEHRIGDENSSLAEVSPGGIAGVGITTEVHPRVIYPTSAQTVPPPSGAPVDILSIEPHAPMLYRVPGYAPQARVSQPTIEAHPRVIYPAAAQVGIARSGVILSIEPHAPMLYRTAGFAVPPPGVSAPESPPAAYAVEVDLDGDGFEGGAEDVTSSTMATPGVNIIIGSDANQRLISPRISTCTYEVLFPIVSGLDRDDPTRVRATFDNVTYPLFLGTVDDLPFDPSIDKKVMKVKARGALSTSPERSGASTQVYNDIRIDEAIEQVLIALGITSYSLGTATRGNLTRWWLDSRLTPLEMLKRLVRTEGPAARLYSDQNGVVIFEPQTFRTTEVRTTTSQATYSGTGSEPIYSRMAPVDDASRRIANRVELRQQVRDPDTDEITYVGNTTAKADASNTSITVTKPENLHDGDIMEAHITMRDNEGTNPTGVSGPEGWTLIHSGGVADSDDFRSNVYWKRADGTDTTDSDGNPVTSYQWTWTGACTAAITIDVYRGCVENGTPHEVFQIDSNIDNEPSPTSTSITTLGANRRVVSFLASNQTSPGTITAPAGFAKRSTAVGTLTAPSSTQGALSADSTAFTAGDVGALTWIGAGAGVDSVLTTIALIPRSTIVWKAGEDIILAPDEVKVIVVRTTNPVENAQAPTVGPDFVISDGGLASDPALNRTSGTSIEITMAAGPAGAIIEGPEGTEDNDDEVAPRHGMQMRADPLTVTITNEVTSETGAADRPLMSSYTVWPLLALVDMQSLADDLVSYLATSKQLIKITVKGDRDADTLRGLLQRRISDRIRIVETRAPIDVEGHIEEIRYHIGKGKLLTVTMAVREA